jgi:ATP-dependent exoDNAse (exonuclease V) alpha subunit
LAIFHLQIKSISRGAGRSATAAAAYRAGERIRDERTGVLHNYSRRTDVHHKEILLPSGLDTADVAWAMDRERLWNAAEAVESRRNARLAREYQVALPAELNEGQRVQLARCFARELANRYKVAVDLAVHAPRAAGDPRNHHAHLLVTSRELTATGFGPKAGLDMQSDERRRRGLPAGIAEMKSIRERWALLSNEALADAGVELRIHHGSLRSRGIDREPVPKIPFAAFQMERRGLRSEIAERIRERYRARVQARQSRSQGLDLETLRRQAREAWQQLREQAAAVPEAAQPRPHREASSSTPSPTPQDQAAHPRAHKSTAERLRAASALERDAADRDFAL